ncbi:hypothetical protein AYI69_g6835 [Smittium culicis]|uniref:CCHC-type domain-containing protein n=1 Tax=Smittium culicis TaxID=133412 RepID=A0A1R1XWE3_9FUNG|nr:hypothetical protein AYI69_g6835 [Smittium culicis]
MVQLVYLPSKNLKKTKKKLDCTFFQDLGDYKDESIFRWYKGETHKKNLKKLCFGGSDYMIGCPWEKFGKDKNNGINYITSQINNCISEMYSKFAKTTYFIFEEKEHAAKFLHTKYFHNRTSIELFGSIIYADEVTIIKVPQLKFVRLKLAIRICEMIEKHGEVKFICARVKKNTSVLLPFGMQILLVKIKNAEIPNLIIIEDEIIGLFWKGCPKACNFCKKSDHWKSECPTIKAKEDLRKSKKNKNSKAKEAKHEDKADHTAEKNETKKIPGMIQPVLANEKLAIPTANKVDAPITAAKPAIIADSKNINDTAQTPTKPATDRKLAVPADNLKEKNSTQSDNANSSGMDIESSDIEVKKEPNSSQEGHFTQDSGYNEYNKVYDDFRRGRIDKTTFEAYNASRFGPPPPPDLSRYQIPGDPKDSPEL